MINNQNIAPAKNGFVSYTFEGNVWTYNSPASWYFVSVPKTISEEIRTLFKQWEEGWGRLKCKAQIGKTVWETAIWFDTKYEAYTLPIKAEIRKKENIQADQHIVVYIKI